MVKQEKDSERIDFFNALFWDDVFAACEKLRLDLLSRAARETVDHDRRLGKLEGCEETVRMLRNLIQSNR